MHAVGLGVDVGHRHGEPAVTVAHEVAGCEDEGVRDGAMDAVEHFGEEGGGFLDVCFVGIREQLGDEEQRIVEVRRIGFGRVFAGVANEEIRNAGYVMLSSCGSLIMLFAVHLFTLRSMLVYNSVYCTVYCSKLTSP